MSYSTGILTLSTLPHLDYLQTAIDALQSVGAQVDAGREDDTSGVLLVLPRLHMDLAIELMLFIAVLRANSETSAAAVAPHSAESSQSKQWTRAAFWAHQCMIGGDQDVFSDRWDTADFAPALRVWKQPVTD